MSISFEIKISNVKVDGKDLELNKKHYISLSDYILDGKGRYIMFAKYPAVNE